MDDKHFDGAIDPAVEEEFDEVYDFVIAKGEGYKPTELARYGCPLCGNPARIVSGDVNSETEDVDVLHSCPSHIFSGPGADWWKICQEGIYKGE